MQSFILSSLMRIVTHMCIIGCINMYRFSNFQRKLAIKPYSFFPGLKAHYDFLHFDKSQTIYQWIFHLSDILNIERAAVQSFKGKQSQMIYK